MIRDFGQYKFNLIELEASSTLQCAVCATPTKIDLCVKWEIRPGI